ncbi:Nucleic acid-binding, OB-fold [Penicillium italicum]|uniref:CST complex subunit STN1 n=1 Tax=Penicillium italicum TaxID=40296 RepID=A0A0A2KYZ6_PENIT|nr:Nucleic acid-binding, OB-fold [Penicillium italicum]
MATVNNENLVFYPAFCFKASPTHFTWVKMGAADVHRLRKSSDFVGQNIFFYNNHPIQFVSLVGIIVARTDIPRRTILTLDDSSGATIDIAVLKKTSPKPSIASQATPTTSQGTTTTSQEKPAWSSFSLTTPTAISLTQEIHLTSKDHDEIDISALQPGTLVRVKGTLSTFRSQMQLHLERFWLVRDTNAEMQFLDTRLRFLIEVLSVPWDLTDEEVEELRSDAERCDERVLEDKRRAERIARKRVEREERHAKAIARRYEKEEHERERQLKKIREDGERVMRKFGFGDAE